MADSPPTPNSRLEMARRRDVRDELYGDAATLAPATTQALVELGTDIYMVERSSTGPLPPPTRFPQHFEPVYTGDEIRLYRFNR